VRSGEVDHDSIAYHDADERPPLALECAELVRRGLGQSGSGDYEGCGEPSGKRESHERSPKL
jgi:hypothetical protein